MSEKENIEKHTTVGVLSRPWRVQFNNIIGGWCLTLASDKRTPADGAVIIADFVSREVAANITRLHNRRVTISETCPKCHEEPGIVGEKCLSDGINRHWWHDLAEDRLERQS